MKRTGSVFLHLFRFEWKKHFQKPSIWLALILFTVGNLVQINNVFTTKSLLSSALTDARWKTVYWERYDQFSGSLTDEKIKALMDIYRPLERKTADLTASAPTNDPNYDTGNAYSDRLFFKWCFVEPMEYAYLYPGYAKGIVERAEENSSFYASLGNGYESAKNAQIAGLFSGRRVDRFVYTEPYSQLFRYDLSAVFTLLLVLYGLCGVFVSEKESGMDLLLPTGYHGGRVTTGVKLLVSGSFSAGLCLWFCLSDVAGILISFGTLTGGTLPLYALKGFANTPLNCTIFQYLLLCALLRFLGIWVIGLLLLAVSRLFQTTLLPFLLGVTGVLGLLALHYGFSGSAALWVRALNPISLIFSRELFVKAEFVNLLGVPVPLQLVAVTAALVVTAGTTALLLFRPKKSIGRRKGERR